ncbi:MAG: TIGR02452 family protein [Parachlamydiaceae bacterium]
MSSNLLPTERLPPSTGLISILSSSCSRREKTVALFFKLCGFFSSPLKERSQKRITALLVGNKKLKDIQKISGIVFEGGSAKEKIKLETSALQRVEVKDTTTLEAAMGLSNAVVLDIANSINPGGAFMYSLWHGSQEESICENTTLYSRLRHAKDLSQSSQFIKERECLMFPDVEVIYKNKTKEFIANEAERPKLDVVATAAIDFRRSSERRKFAEGKKENGKYQLNQAGKALTQQKMRAVLTACQQSNKKNIVLGAMGCGAFLNRPEDIAECWKEVIGEFPQDSFDKVIFAITANSPKDQHNLKTFQDKFSTL